MFSNLNEKELLSTALQIAVDRIKYGEDEASATKAAKAVIDSAFEIEQYFRTVRAHRNSAKGMMEQAQAFLETAQHMMAAEKQFAEATK